MSRRLLSIKLVVFALCIYFGSGAYTQWDLLKLWDMPVTDNTPITVNGILYKNSKAADIAIASSAINALYPWAEVLQYYWQAIGVLAATCGASGGFLREVFYDIQNSHRTVHNWMLLGSLMGPSIVLCVSGFREMLIEGGDYRTWSIAALSFLSGCFSEEAFQYLKGIYERVGKEILN